MSGAHPGNGHDPRSPPGAGIAADALRAVAPAGGSDTGAAIRAALAGEPVECSAEAALRAAAILLDRVQQAAPEQLGVAQARELQPGDVVTAEDNRGLQRAPTSAWALACTRSLWPVIEAHFAERLALEIRGRLEGEYLDRISRWERDAEQQAAERAYLARETARYQGMRAAAAFVRDLALCAAEPNAATRAMMLAGLRTEISRVLAGA